MPLARWFSWFTLFAIAAQAQIKLPDFDIRWQAEENRPSAGAHVLIPKAGPQQRSAAFSNPLEAAKDFLPASQEFRLLRQDASDGVTLLDFQRTIGGIPVFEAHAKVAVGAGGAVLAATFPGDGPDRLEVPDPQIAIVDAVRLAFRAVGVTWEGDQLRAVPTQSTMLAFANPFGEGRMPVLVEVTAFPVSGAEARLGWRILVEPAPSQWFEVVIDARNGNALYHSNLRKSAGSGRVFKVSPDKGERDFVSFPDSWLALNINITAGNNADAYLDTDGDDRPDSLPDAGIRDGHAFAQNQLFDFPAPAPNATQDPRGFKAAAVTNAFYFANAAHDYFYNLGFTEEAGNFQRDNAGKGGRDNDPVFVEVQDLFQLNNAGFLPTPDGVSPRMELGIFTLGTPGRTDDRDFAYDGQTTVHEYTHGVTNRLVGGGTSTSCLTGVQSGALDEGWADYYASSFFNDPVRSAYLSPIPARGIRRQSYEGYTLTYEDLGNDGFEQHRDGELWAATLWDLRKTLGQQTTDRLVLRGLRLTPCRPTFIDARDAILAADQALNSGANRSAILSVFARHGMGASTGGTDGVASVSTVFNAAFDLPPDLQPGNRAPMVTSRPTGLAVTGEPFTYQIQA